MNPLQHRSQPSAKAVLRSGGFHVSTNDDGQRDCGFDGARRGASQVSSGVFKEVAPPKGDAEAVAGLTSRHRALLARFARNKVSTHHGRDDLNGKRVVRPRSEDGSPVAALRPAWPPVPPIARLRSASASLPPDGVRPAVCRSVRVNDNEGRFPAMAS
jgi:hypothetical protein